VGTSYGEVIEGTAFVCLIEGTKIAMADGSEKNIEDITYEDELLVWNFDECHFDTAKPVWMVRPFTMEAHNLVEFSDGTKLGTIAGIEGHCIFNAQRGAFTYMNTADTPEGTDTFSVKGHTVSLIGTERISEETRFYNIMTYKHVNMFANGILTSSKLNNVYPIKNMEFVKTPIDLRNRNEFNVSDEMFEGLRLAEQPRSYSKLMAKLDSMVQEMK
jgi:hypothetical protein